jgi:hypothetical protein
MPDISPLVVYVMGPTCVGKSSLIAAAQEKWGDELGLVEVGKYLRNKYPPGHFKGQANPKHVHTEAVELYKKFVEQHIADGKEIILVDGQPRQNQAGQMLCHYPALRRLFIQLDASVEIRSLRIKTRFANASHEDIDLAIKRLDNDRMMGYDTLIDLLSMNQVVKVFSTTRPAEVWTGEVIDYIVVQRRFNAQETR